MSRARSLFLAVALALFLGFSTYQLALPGLHYDEAFDAVPAMQLLLGQPVTTFRGNGIPLGGRLFPLMTQDYIGALNTYLAIPFFALLGVNIMALRAMAVAIGLLTLWLTYRLADELYGIAAAIVAVLLLAVSPTFIFWSRQGVFVTSVTAAIGLASGLVWLRWWRTGAPWYAAVGGFLLGLGLYAKFLFLWLSIALGLSVLLLNIDRWRYLRSRLTTSLLGSTTLGFLLGISPLIIYNLQTGGTLRSVSDNLTTSYYGIDNLAVLPNLLERLRQFGAALAGSHFWYLGQAHANWLGPGLFLVAMGTTLWLLPRSPRPERRRVLFPFTVIGGVILTSWATVSALWVTHFAILSPWPALAIAAAADLFVRRSGARLQSKRVNLALVLVLVAVGTTWIGDAITDVRYHRSLAISGGLGAHSDAVEDLARWLMEDDRLGAPVVAMDWGIAAPVAFLSSGKVRPVEAFGYEWETDTDFAARLQPFLNTSTSIYLWRAPDEIIFDRGNDFRRLVQPYGLEEDILEAFYEKSGRPILGATRLVPRGTAVNPPRPLEQH